MQDDWTLSGLYEQIVGATALSISRAGRIVELHVRTQYCDLRYRTELFWR